MSIYHNQIKILKIFFRYFYRLRLVIICLFYIEWKNFFKKFGRLFLLILLYYKQIKASLPNIIGTLFLNYFTDTLISCPLGTVVSMTLAKFSGVHYKSVSVFTSTIKLVPGSYTIPEPFIRKPPKKLTAAATATAPPSVLPLPSSPFIRGTLMPFTVLIS